MTETKTQSIAAPILERVKKLGFSVGEIAREAGLASSTPTRWETADPNSRSLRDFENVLIKKERAIYEHLKQLPHLAENETR